MVPTISADQSAVRSDGQSIEKRSSVPTLSPAAYPQRSRFFAIRVLQKLLHHSIGVDIGVEACWLITCIAIREDSFGYSRPLKFWNHQLQEMTGLGSWGRLDRARQKAVQSGWLQYRPGKNRGIGEYWTTVPRGLDGDLNAVKTEKEHCSSPDHFPQNGDRIDEPSIPDDGLKREPVQFRETTSAAQVPRKDQVIAYAAELGFSATQSAAVFEYYESRHWHTETGPVVNWKSLVAKCLATAAPKIEQQRCVNQRSQSIELWDRLLKLLQEFGPYDNSHTRIREQIGDVGWDAARSIGLCKIDSATEFELPKLRQKFLSAISVERREQ